MRLLLRAYLPLDLRLIRSCTSSAATIADAASMPPPSRDAMEFLPTLLLPLEAGSSRFATAAYLGGPGGRSLLAVPCNIVEECLEYLEEPEEVAALSAPLFPTRTAHTCSRSTSSECSKYSEMPSQDKTFSVMEEQPLRVLSTLLPHWRKH